MSENVRFQDLGLSQITLDAIQKKGFEEPTDIQAQTIPVMLQKNTHMIAQAQTGTGKTAAFGLPLMDLVDCGQNHVQALILAPTRELAIQVSEELYSLKGNRDLRVVPIYGGQSIDQQFRRLRKGAHIVVGTPGRIIDHLNRKTLKVDRIEHLILDEADEMLNMGFIEDMEEIMKHTPESKWTLLFSATMPRRIKDLAENYMKDYKSITIKKKQLTTNLTEQIYYEIKHSDKFEALCRIIDLEEDFYGLVFCRTKQDVDNIVSHMLERGYDSEAIHGDISQAQRERTLSRFRKKTINILVATDVAARGIDINDLTHVINYSLPSDPESYVHRIGRTGRAGKEGTAITFITPSEYRKLMFIQKIAQAEIKKSQVPKVKDIIKAKKRKVYQDLQGILEEGKLDEKYYNWAKKLQEEKEPTEILAALLNYCFHEDIDPEHYGEIQDVSRGKGDYSSRRPPLDLEGKARLFVALGKKDSLTAPKLVQLIQTKVEIRSSEIGDVQVMDSFSFVTVPFKKAESIIDSFKDRGKRPLVTLAQQKKSGGSSRTGGSSRKKRQ